MPFWGWVLIYVAGFMVAFRVMFLRRKDATQRWLAAGKQNKVTRENKYGTRFRVEPEVAMENREIGDVGWPTLQAILWPLMLLFLGLWGFQKIIWFIMFPRGVRTKFDRELELEKKLAEETKALEAAKELLQREGINA